MILKDLQVGAFFTVYNKVFQKLEDIGYFAAFLNCKRIEDGVLCHVPLTTEIKVWKPKNTRTSMLNLFKSFWADDAGYMLTTESVLITTVATLGVIGGLSGLRDATLGDMQEITNTMKELKISKDKLNLNQEKPRENKIGQIVDAPRYPCP